MLNCFVFYKNTINPTFIFFDPDGLELLKFNQQEYRALRESVILCQDKFDIIEKGVVKKNTYNEEYEKFRLELSLVLSEIK